MVEVVLEEVVLGEVLEVGMLDEREVRRPQHADVHGETRKRLASVVKEGRAWGAERGMMSRRAAWSQSSGSVLGLGCDRDGMLGPSTEALQKLEGL